MSETAKQLPLQQQSQHEPTSRRTFLLRLGLLLNAIAAIIFAIPVLGYLASPMRKFRVVILDFPGTAEISPSIRRGWRPTAIPITKPWDGETANVPCWVRHEAGETFQVFAINCTHLGCPVRWFQESELFMCPCHGGVYYSDGKRASGPPPRGALPVQSQGGSGQLWVKAGRTARAVA